MCLFDSNYVSLWFLSSRRYLRVSVHSGDNGSRGSLDHGFPFLQSLFLVSFEEVVTYLYNTNSKILIYRHGPGVYSLLAALCEYREINVLCNVEYVKKSKSLISSSVCVHRRFLACWKRSDPE